MTGFFLDSISTIHSKATRVVIVGGGFGGLNAAQALKKADVEVWVIDKTNHHLFQPLLYQVAGAALAPGNIAVPIREVLRRQANAFVLMTEIVSVDVNQCKLTSLDGAEFFYDYLILAPGASHSYFGKDEWEVYAPGLKTVDDAIRIREKVLLAFECAERCSTQEEAAKFLRFVVIGGGPTGVEMAGSIAEIANKTLFENFRKIKPEQSEIYLIEGAEQVLPVYSSKLGDIAHQDLEKMGVKVLVNTKVTDLNAEGVWMGETFLPTMNVIWAAGNQAAPVLKTLGIPVDKQGRVKVQPDLSIEGHPNVFVIGDAALAYDKKGNSLPGIAPTAIQQGKYVAKVIRKELRERDGSNKPRAPFRYFDKGSMATIGKAKAVAKIGSLEFSGFIAWLAWCFIHIAYLISFKNRILVMLQWFYLYLSGARTERLIINPLYQHPQDTAWYKNLISVLFPKKKDDSTKIK